MTDTVSADKIGRATPPLYSPGATAMLNYSMVWIHSLWEYFARNLSGWYEIQYIILY